MAQRVIGPNHRARLLDRAGVKWAQNVVLLRGSDGVQLI